MRRMIVFGLLVGLLGAGVARAEGGGGMMGHGRGMGGGHMPLGEDPGLMLPLLLRSADLTPAQRDQVRTIMQSHQQRLQTLFAEVRTASEKLGDRLFSAGDVTATSLDPDVRAVLDKRGQLMREGLAVALEVRKVLTPAQLAKAADVRTRVRALHDEMRTLLGPPPGMPGGEEAPPQ